MKTRFGVCLCLALAAVSPAQEVPTVTTVPAAEAPLRTAAELETLLGPIALYPDALIALILPASTAPVDIVLAARFLKDGGDPNNTSARAWDESVKSLSHYPDVVKWMDENIEWTKQLGDAFLRQPTEVMNAVQRLRERARDAGTLFTTPQQQVAVQDNLITIVPAQPNVIYVPRYEPEYVYVSQPVYYTQPFISFGVGFAVGPWLTHDCDWRARRIWVANRSWNWREHRDWRHPVFPGQTGYVSSPYRQPWRPPPPSVRPPMPYSSFARVEFSRPTPMPGTPVYSTPATRREPANRRPNTTVATQTPQPDVANSPQPSPWTANATRNRAEPITLDRRARQNNPSTQTAFNNPPAGSFPYGSQPTAPVVAPINGQVVPQITEPVVRQISRPVVTPIAPQQQESSPRPRISMTPTPSVNNSPSPYVPHATQQAQAQRASPPPPPPQQQPQAQPQQQPAPRDDKDNRRREQP